MALDLVGAINAAAGTTGLEFNQACNEYANTVGQGLDGVGALNTLAGNPRGQWKELAGVLNQLALTSGLEAQGAAQLLLPLP